MRQTELHLTDEDRTVVDEIRRAASSLNCNTSSPDEVPRWMFEGATSSSSRRSGS
jgi:hypothetical protein